MLGYSWCEGCHPQRPLTFIESQNHSGWKSPPRTPVQSQPSPIPNPPPAPSHCPHPHGSGTPPGTVTPTPGQLCQSLTKMLYLYGTYICNALPDSLPVTTNCTQPMRHLVHQHCGFQPTGFRENCDGLSLWVVGGTQIQALEHL